MSTAVRIDQDVPEKAPEPELRGDPILGEAYTSREFFAREWKMMWARTWHIGVLEYQLPEPGDFATCDLGPESFISSGSRMAVFAVSSTSASTGAPGSPSPKKASPRN